MNQDFQAVPMKRQMIAFEVFLEEQSPAQTSPKCPLTRPSKNPTEPKPITIVSNLDLVTSELT